MRFLKTPLKSCCLTGPISPPPPPDSSILPLVLSETPAWGLNTYGSSWSILWSSDAVNSDSHKSASARLRPQTRAHSHSSPGVQAEIWPRVLPSAPPACWRCHPVRDSLCSGPKARTQWPATTPAKAPRGFDLLRQPHVTMVSTCSHTGPKYDFPKHPGNSGFLLHPETALSGLTAFLPQVTLYDISLSLAKYRALLVLFLSWC